MSKDGSSGQRVQVPAHLFESMLRGALSGEGGLKEWKDDLLHWSFSGAQLDQLISALKEGGKAAAHKESAKETIEFIESKIRNRKD